MKILVVGGSGLIGSVLCRAFSNRHEIHYTYNTTKTVIEKCTAHKLDATSQSDVMSLTKKIAPDVVIQASAIASVDICEKKRDLCSKVNVEGTKNIADACKQSGAKIVFISSAAVFDGKKRGYTESDETHAVNYYGETKIQGEQLVISSALPFLIIRTDMPYGWARTEKKGNITLSILDKIARGEEIKEISDRLVNPTYLPNFAEVLLALIEKGCEGIYNIAGADCVTRYKFAKDAAKILAKGATVKPISFIDAGSKVPRANVHLVSKKAEKDSGIRILGVEEGLKRMQGDRISRG